MYDFLENITIRFYYASTSLTMSTTSYRTLDLTTSTDFTTSTTSWRTLDLTTISSLTTSATS